MVFRCYRNDELWLYVHVLFKDMLEILITQCIQCLLCLTSFVENHSRSPSCSLSDHSVSWVLIESDFGKDSAAMSPADEGEEGKEGGAPWASKAGAAEPEIRAKVTYI